MIIIISSQKPDPDSAVDPRFGRAACLLKYDTSLQTWDALENPGFTQSGGAGVAAAQFAIDHHANVVLSGDFGPNASSALKAAGVEMSLFSKEVPSVRAAVEQFLEKNMQDLD
jgi:predicted Fe-Mo cluster-binding NifX family protein